MSNASVKNNDARVGDGAVIASRCHDIVVSLNGKQVGEFEHLSIVGMAVRLALSLRGRPAVSFDLLRQVALHMLQIPPISLRVVIELLADVEFVRLDTEGKTIKSVIPTIPFYEDLFDGIGELTDSTSFSEPEWLTLQIINRLARSPLHRSTVHEYANDKALAEKCIQIGSQGGYTIERRARGRDIIISPLYFPEHFDTLADTTASFGPGRLASLIDKMAKNQGWPLTLARETKMVGDESIDDDELSLITSLASDGLFPAPAIDTTHHGRNIFLFAPKPGIARISPIERPIYEAAMALVAAVRQGQYLPQAYRIRYPGALLRALRDRGRIKANTEALEQYKSLVAMRVGRLELVSGNWHSFVLIETPENLKAVGLAITLIEGDEIGPKVDETASLAFEKGQQYVDSLVSRQVINQDTVSPTDDIRNELDTFLLTESQ